MFSTSLYTETSADKIYPLTAIKGLKLFYDLTEHKHNS